MFGKNSAGALGDLPEKSRYFDEISGLVVKII